MVSAELTRDVELFGKQDPYVIIHYMGVEQKTKVIEGGGKKPVWNETFEIPLQSVSDEIEFHCRDDDVMGSKPIGSTRIKGSALCYNNGVRDHFGL